MKQSMQVMTSMESNEWYTPAWIIDAARFVLGNIDLDPASHPTPQKWIKARRYFTAEDDGLGQDWEGRFFINWPYVKCRWDQKRFEKTGKGWITSPWSPEWAAKTVEQYESGIAHSGIALCFGKIGYNWFENLVTKYPVCFLGLLSFISGETLRLNGSAKHNSCVVYFGRNVELFKATFGRYGWFNDIEHLEHR